MMRAVCLAAFFCPACSCLASRDCRECQAFVSIAPQQYFAQKIGGGPCGRLRLGPPGADPHTYEPKPRQMAELAKAAVLLCSGNRLRKGVMKKIAPLTRHANRSNRRRH